MKQNWIVAYLLTLLTFNVNALELELGIGMTEFPLYNVEADRYPNQYDRDQIGKIAIMHTFDMNEWAGIKLWIDHYSLLSRPETNDYPRGRNMAGASVIFKLY